MSLGTEEECQMQSVGVTKKRRLEKTKAELATI